MLIYLYRQLNKANHTTQKQAVTIHQANEELSAALEHQTMLQGEIHHRVKNNLQVIISLLALQKEDIKDQQAKESLDAMSNRIFSIAAIHEILYPKEGVTKINFSEYTERICNYFGDFNALEDRPNFNIKVKDFEFNIDTGMPLGVILTELITNSLKHARKETEQLFISIELQKLDKWFALTYRDNGFGFPAEKLKDREGGLGAYLLRSMARQLRGQIKTKNNNGAVSVIYFMEK